MAISTLLRFTRNKPVPFCSVLQRQTPFSSSTQARKISMGGVFGAIREEMPAHEVVHNGNGYQVWKYPTSVAAVVSAKSLNAENPPTGKKFGNTAFFTLAGYIGVLKDAQNTKASEPEKIAMTAPVVMSPPQPEKIAMTAPVVMSAPQPEKIDMTAPVVMSPPKEDQTMAFLLPNKYKTVEDAPVPKNPAVKIELMPVRYEAVLEFSGNTPSDQPDICETKAQTLRDAMAKDGIEPTGAYTLCGYNSPFTLPWFKRNEIHFPVARSDKFSES